MLISMKVILVLYQVARLIDYNDKICICLAVPLIYNI